MKGTVLILGATSSIAKAAAVEFAKEGYALYLAGRDPVALERLSQDLYIRYNAIVDYGVFDAKAFDTHPSFFANLVDQSTPFAGVLLAFGYLGHEIKARTDQQEALDIIQQNFTGSVSILSLCATQLEKQKNGFMLVIGSVAGDRGRQSNYYYGAAKAGLHTFVQGLRNRLHPQGIRVVTIKPGFIDTQMTFGLPGVFLAADPVKIGKEIVKTLKKKKDIVYLPRFWRYIMLIIRLIPEPVFKRLSL